MKIFIPKINGATFELTNRGVVAHSRGKSELVVANSSAKQYFIDNNLELSISGDIIAVVKPDVALESIIIPVLESIIIPVVDVEKLDVRVDEINDDVESQTNAKVERRSKRIREA
jgi:hypothetical protein